jgi:glycosyltransferase involved in cell wall biosynthesis
VVGIVARLARVKDHVTLLEAYLSLTALGDKNRLLVVGDGQLRAKLEDLAFSLGISKRVIFAGLRDDIPDLMRAMDIFVLSSLSEGISLTLLEAMACCLPLVATEVGGNPEVVINGETGYLVPPRNPEEMAKKLLLLINNEKLRRQMGEKGRERVIRNFGIKETTRKYEELYNSVLSKG